jgi:hypothetical protein
MRAKTPEESEEIRRLRQELKAMKRKLADEVIDHRIDQALLEILSEDYHIDLAELKKKADGMKSPTG